LTKRAENLVKRVVSNAIPLLDLSGWAVEGSGRDLHMDFFSK
jgi:hypothetical protein